MGPIPLPSPPLIFSNPVFLPPFYNRFPSAGKWPACYSYNTSSYTTFLQVSNGFRVNSRHVNEWTYNWSQTQVLSQVFVIHTCDASSHCISQEAKYSDTSLSLPPVMMPHASRHAWVCIYIYPFKPSALALATSKPNDFQVFTHCNLSPIICRRRRSLQWSSHSSAV